MLVLVSQEADVRAFILHEADIFIVLKMVMEEV